MLNQIRRANPALQTNRALHFHSVDNPNLICYSKSTRGFENTILVVVNLDPFHTQTGWTDLHVERLGLSASESFLVEDLSERGAVHVARPRNYISLRSDVQPAHVFRIARLP